MMKIAILTSGILPVPAVQGGAVENLVDFIWNITTGTICTTSPSTASGIRMWSSTLHASPKSTTTTISR